MSDASPPDIRRSLTSGCQSVEKFGAAQNPWAGVNANCGARIYQGCVFHKRFRPRLHSLKYKVFSILIDIDRLPELDRQVRFFSYNKWNIYSVHDRDFGARCNRELRPQIDAHLQAEGVSDSIARVELLCYPRILGYAFNPLSIFFCYRSDDSIAALLYEVHNTFGDTHTYVIEPRFLADNPRSRGQSDLSDTGQRLVARHQSAKKLHVSPFAPMQMRYDFRITEPSSDFSVQIYVSDEKGLMLSASFDGSRKAFTSKRLLWNMLFYPLMTVKITVGIHWEALLLWFKGVPWFARSKPASGADGR